MPIYEHRTRVLPPANLTATELLALEDALMPEFDGRIEWTLWIGQRSISNSSVAALLEEVADMHGFSDFEIAAELDDASITVNGGPDGTAMESDASHALAGMISGKTRQIEGLFRDSKRRSAILPGPITALPIIKGFARPPQIKVGTPGFKLEIDWSKLAQTVLTNWLSHLGVAAISFGAGLVIGWLV